MYSPVQNNRGSSAPELPENSGIVVTRDGRYAVVVQSNTGRLFRVDLGSRAVSEVDLSRDASRREVESETSDPSFRFPTTAAVSGKQLLVVNSRFDKRGCTPEQPFTVSSIRKP